MIDYYGLRCNPCPRLQPPIRPPRCGGSASYSACSSWPWSPAASRPFLWKRELQTVVSVCGLEQAPSGERGGLSVWILAVYHALQDVYQRYPWMAYGTDWLAFAHVAIAVFFLGPLRRPVQNIWVLQAGLIVCGLLLPLALICGAIRQIPLGWRLIDCSFGVFGAVPLYYCLRLARTIEQGIGCHRNPGGR